MVAPGAAEALERERAVFDFVSAGVLFVTALGGSWLPRYLSSRGGESGTDSAAFHLMNMLSGGVMLSAGFCHLLADALPELAFKSGFPAATFLAGAGYLLTLFADQAVQLLSEDYSSSSSKGGDRAAASAGSVVIGRAVGGDIEAPPSGVKASPPPKAIAVASAAVVGAAAASRTASHQRQLHELHAAKHFAPEAEALLVERPERRASNGANAAAHSHLGAILERKLPFGTAVLLAVALCVHSILEGIAMGAQHSMRDTEDIMIAVSAHKGLAAYALGASVVQSGASTRRFWAVIGLFSAATPLGIALGFAFSEVSSGAGGAAMSALAAGTFLYVALAEVIPRELSVPNDDLRSYKLLALVTGFALMSLLAIWA